MSSFHLDIGYSILPKWLANIFLETLTPWSDLKKKKRHWPALLKNDSVELGKANPLFPLSPGRQEW